MGKTPFDYRISTSLSSRRNGVKATIRETGRILFSMALTPSTMLPLGTKAPAFTLTDTVSGKPYSLDSFAGQKALLVMFICRHCPYVQHVGKELARLSQDYAGKDVGLVAISANDADNYPEDAPEKLKRQAQDAGFLFPYLYDRDQSAAKAYTAACTPDFFLFDSDRCLVYRGQLDDSRPSNGKPITGADLRAALDNTLADKPTSPHQKPSIGCNIKWKSGNEPSYFK
jgi:peroxiredoxin